MDKWNSEKFYIYHAHIMPTSTNAVRIWARWCYNGPQKDSIFEVTDEEQVYLERGEEGRAELVALKVKNLLELED